MTKLIKHTCLGVASAILVLTSWSVASAAEKGTVELGFQLGGNGAVGEQSLPMVAPYFAVFLNKELSLGGSLVYETGSIEGQEADLDYSILGLEASARYHIKLDSDSKYLPFLEGGIRYYSYELEKEEVKFNSFMIGGGVKYQIYRDVYSNLKLQYTTGEVGDVDTSAFRISAGLSVQI